MGAIKGQNLRLFVNQVAIAAAKTCEVHVRLDVQDSSTKDDTGDWAHNTVVRLSWDCRVSGLVTVDPDRNDAASLADRIGQEVEVQFAVAGGQQNSEREDILMSGLAIISDVQLTAQNKEDSVYTVALTGQADLLSPLGVMVTSNLYRMVTSNNKVMLCSIGPA